MTMPEMVIDPKKRISKEELEAFRAWFRSVYGALQLFTVGTVATDPRYAYWLSIGSPDPRPSAAPVPEWAKVPQSGPFYIGDYPEPPFQLGPGFEWAKKEYSDTGVPIRPEWVASATTSKGSPTAPKTPEIVSIRGQDFMPTYDEQGNITGYVPLGETSNAAATQAEAARQFNEQMGLSREQFAFQREQAAKAERQTQAELQAANANQRAAALYGAMGPKPQDVSAAERAQIYEQVRSDVLGGITSPRDWIKYLQVKGAPNPYQPKEPDMESSYNALTEELKRATSVADIVRGRLKDLNDPLTPAALANPKSTEEQLAALALNNESDLKGKLVEFQIVRGQGAANAGQLTTGWTPSVLSQSEAQRVAQQQNWAMPKPSGNGNMTIYGSPEMPAQPTGTAIPEWMKEYVPGLQGKQFLEQAPNAKVTRPSAQSWQRLSDTQAQMLGGLAEYAGQDWSEMLRQMALERPKAAPIPQRSAAFRQR